MAILPTLRGPGDLRGLSEPRLLELAEEIRRAIISTVATTGGHLGSSLGVVEITLALHRILESPRDRIVWDTGHQAYPHKLLTGRYARFGTLRQLGGIGGFPRRSESEHDVFDGGHAGTGLSIAAGLATARDVRHGMERIAVVVGDAALMSGLSLEALNDIGQRRTPMPHRPQRQRDVDQPLGRGTLEVPLGDQALHRLAAVEAGLRPARRAGADGRADRPGVQPTRPQVGRQLRPAGPALRGSRHHLHRSRSRPRPADPRAHVPERPSPSMRRSSSTSGPRRAGATTRRRRTRSASTAPPCPRP